MKNVKKLSRKFKALSNPNRLKIIELLLGECMCVCRIEEALNLNQNLVSHHLKVLKDAKLVEVCKCGKWRHYEVNRDELLTLQTCFNI